MSVPHGQVLGFLGPNGAGKSTTMKMIAGFLEPTSGTAKVSGLDVMDDPVEVKRRIGYLPEGAPTYGDMTPASFLDFVAAVRGFDGAERQRRVDEAVEKVSLKNVLRQPVDTLSKGFKRRVALAQSIVHDPKVLILDEPTDGLDPNQKHHVRSLITDMAADKAIIISTHILEEVEAVCDRAVVIAEGRLVADGTPEELISRAPNHNAVIVKVEAAHAAGAKEALAGMDRISEVVTAKPVNGVAQLCVRPTHGSAILGDVGDALRTKNVNVQELFVERGALDEVFRRITTDAKKGDGGNA
jgi:ABC-2 type transport system ATP-binding protein